LAARAAIANTWSLAGFSFVKSFRMVRSGYFPCWFMSSLFVYCPRLAVPLATLVMGLGQLGLRRPEPGTWVVSGIDVVIVYCYYLVRLTRYGTPVPQPLPI